MTPEDEREAQYAKELRETLADVARGMADLARDYLARTSSLGNIELWKRITAQAWLERAEIISIIRSSIPEMVGQKVNRLPWRLEQRYIGPSTTPPPKTS